MSEYSFSKADHAAPSVLPKSRLVQGAASIAYLLAYGIVPSLHEGFVGQALAITAVLLIMMNTAFVLLELWIHKTEIKQAEVDNLNARKERWRDMGAPMTVEKRSGMV